MVCEIICHILYYNKNSYGKIFVTLTSLCGQYNFKYGIECKCQYKNDQKVENKNVHFPRSIPQFVFP